MPSVGERIKELRESVGYSVDEFAKLLGVHRSTVYRYEGWSESRDLPITVAITIAEKFGVSLEWLAGTSDKKYRADSGLNEVIDSLSDEGKKAVMEYAMFIKAKEDNDGK